MPATTDFLKSLKSGDRVLVCRPNGEIYTEGTVDCAKRSISIVCPVPLWPDERFSPKTGKQYGGSLYLHPIDNRDAVARYRARIAEQEKACVEAQERRAADDAAVRVQYMIAATIALDSNVVNTELLNDFTTKELETLVNLLCKLKPSVRQEA